MTEVGARLLSRTVRGRVLTQAESEFLARIEPVLTAAGGGDTCFQEERPFAYELRNFSSAILDTTVFSTGEALAFNCSQATDQ